MANLLDNYKYSKQYILIEDKDSKIKKVYIMKKVLKI